LVWPNTSSAERCTSCGFTRGGRSGLVGIECKYTAPFSPTPYDKPRYRDVFEQTNEAFTASYEELVQSRYNQLLRTHLLSQALRLAGDFTEVHTCVFSSGLKDDACPSIAADFGARVRQLPSSRFFQLDFIAFVSQHRIASLPRLTGALRVRSGTWRSTGPKAASFQNVALVDTGGKQALCGEVNAKDSFGGYNGYRAFLVMDGGVTFVGANKVERYKVWPQMNAAGCGPWFAEYELRVPVGEADNSVSDALDDAEARLRGLK
jgi:hypothetical protein